MASLTDLREGLAVNVRAITGIQATAHILSNPTPPTVWVYPAPIDYHQASQNGAAKYEFVVEVFVGMFSDKGAQAQLDKYIDSGPRCIKEKLETADTPDERVSLGGACDDLIVRRCSGYRPVMVDGKGPYLTAEWRVEVYAAG